MAANAQTQIYKSSFSNAADNPFGDGADREGSLQQIYSVWRIASGTTNEAALL